MRILFLSRWFPYPLNNGSKVRIYNLLRGLAQRHELTLLSFTEPNDGVPNMAELHSFCQVVQTTPWKPFDPQSRRGRLGFFSVTPRSAVDTFSPQMKQTIEQTLSAQQYDLVIASQEAMASYSDAFQGRPALFEEVELGVFYEQFKQAKSIQARLRYGLTWLKYRHYLGRLLRRFHACTVVSEREKQMLASVAPNDADIRVIPNCIRLADYQVQVEPQPNTLIFTGPFHYHANYDAMQWFLSEVYPRVQAQMPEIRLTITGDHANRPLPPASNLTLTGFVDDVRPLIAQAWISLAPLRIGGGTRVKILEAMALGTPVVATSKGAEGLDVQPGKQLLIADTPEAFAQSIIRLCKEPGLRQKLNSQAYQVAAAQYDWAATMPRFLDLVEQVGQGKN